VASTPLIVLHDHLDGGLRPATLLDLARTHGYSQLPTWDVEELTHVLRAPAGSDLVRYLESFIHPLAVLQTQEALERVAYEAVCDWQQDGVLYGEIRFAPELHLRNGLTMQQACQAVLKGLSQGPVPSRLIVTAMRNQRASLEAASVAAELQHLGVVGFDLAGPEIGWPLHAHREAIALAKDAGLGITLHAGEADGPHAVAEALDLGASRIGHGVSAVHDQTVLQRIRDTGVVLEVCVTSNIQTGVTPDIASHPVQQLWEAGVLVSLQSDNRTVSNTTSSKEHALVTAVLGSEVDRRSLEAALHGVFLSDEEKLSLQRVALGERG
jgi:adenosine deaminase